MRSRLFPGCAVLMMLMMASSAVAETVTMSGPSIGRGRSTFHLYYTPSSYDVGHVFSGQQIWDITATNLSGVSLGTTVLFCSDIFQWAGSGSGVWQAASLANTPGPPSSSGMGSARAAMITHLYNVYYDAAAASTNNSSTNNVAAAFQLVIWEIINEGDGNAFDLTSGDFYVTGSGLTWAVANLANQMLDDVINHTNSTANPTANYSLMGLTSETRQDYIIIVPLPPAIALMAIGVPALLVLRRFKGLWAA